MQHWLPDSPLTRSAVLFAPFGGYLTARRAALRALPGTRHPWTPSRGFKIFFPPLTISTALALVSLGARTTMLSQLLSGLGFNDITNWEKPINSLNTRRGDFYVDEESKVKVPMMNKVSWFETYHDKILSCKVVKLPYKSNVSALFILPDQGKMKQLENALSKDVLLKWRNSTKSQ
uniref:plasma serine protease inhibitor-like n=1 Tax=Podarcis muralis TaxID=64176 RepID=UPI0010A023DD|nr:plasma serine protease inhibitor-like [Podarcis muralis]